MFARLHNHPSAGLRFVKNFDTPEEALRYQEVKEPNEPADKPPQVYEVLVVPVAAFMAQGETADEAVKNMSQGKGKTKTT